MPTELKDKVSSKVDLMKETPRESIHNLEFLIGGKLSQKELTSATRASGACGIFPLPNHWSKMRVALG